MSVRKIQCPACSRRFDADAGPGRARCSACGYAFALRGIALDTSGRTEAEPYVHNNADRPVGVRRIPVAAPEIPLGYILQPDVKPGGTLLCSSYVFSGMRSYPAFEDVQGYVGSVIRFCSMLALICNAGFPVSGKLILDAVPKYLPGEASEDRRKDPSKPFAPDEIARLQEARRIYGDSDRLKRNNRVVYDRSVAERSFQQAYQMAEALQARFGFSYSDAEIERDHQNEEYRKTGFLAGSGKHFRAWAVMSTERTVHLDVTPDYAKKMLSALDREHLERMGRHKLLVDAAEMFAGLLIRGYHRQLRDSRPARVWLMTTQFEFGLGSFGKGEDSDITQSCTYGFEAAASLLRIPPGEGGYYTKVLFKQSGMNLLTDSDLQLMLLAQLYGRIRAILRSKDEEHWRVCRLVAHFRYGNAPGYGAGICLEPEAKTEKVYDDWL